MKRDTHTQTEQRKNQLLWHCWSSSGLFSTYLVNSSVSDLEPSRKCFCIDFFPHPPPQIKVRLGRFSIVRQLKLENDECLHIQLVQVFTDRVLLLAMKRNVSTENWLSCEKIRYIMNSYAIYVRVVEVLLALNDGAGWWNLFDMADSKQKSLCHIFYQLLYLYRKSEQKEKKRILMQ